MNNNFEKIVVQGLEKSVEISVVYQEKTDTFKEKIANTSPDQLDSLI